MTHITLANTNKIVFNSEIKKLDLSGEIYKLKIYFFSKYEENALLAIQELLKDPEKYFTEIHVPYKPIDTFTYVYEGKHPAYHKATDCPRLNAKYENFEIPNDIKEKGEQTVKEFRSWFETVKHLLETPDVFVMRLQARWNIITNPKAISRNNSGSNEIEKLTIKELEEKIDSKIKEAGRFYYANSKNTEILKRFSKCTFLAYKDSSIYNNNAQYSDSEVKKLLKKYDSEFKKPLKKMLIEYYRLKFNPEIKMEGEILEQLGFKPCGICYNEYISIEELLGKPVTKENKSEDEGVTNDDLPF